MGEFATDGTVLRVRGLPPGMFFDRTEQLIYGAPRRPGVFNIRVIEEHPDGSRTNTRHTVEVAPLPEHVVGNFHIVVNADQTLNGNMGGEIRMQVNARGIATARARLGDTVVGGLRGQVDVDNSGNAQVWLWRWFGGDEFLDVEVNIQSNNRVNGAVWVGFDQSASLSGWRDVWHGRQNPIWENRTGRFNTIIDLAGNTHAGSHSVPQGFGHAAIMVNPGGQARVRGRLADGTTFTGAAPLSPSAQIALWESLYQRRGAVLLEGAINHLGRVTGDGHWIKQPQPQPRARNYRDGFGTGSGGPVGLTFAGGRWNPPQGEPVLNFGTASPNARLYFAHGGLEDVTGTSATVPATLSHTPALTIHDATGGGALEVLNARLNRNTGLLTGRFRLESPHPANPDRPLRRNVRFEGLAVPSEGLAAGFFLLPEPPDPPKTPARQTPVRSGQVILEQP